MFLNKPIGSWSVLLSVIGSLLFFMPYLISPASPGGMVVAGMKIISVVAIICLVFGIVASLVAIKMKETGVKKYAGILLPILIILLAVLLPILMGIGFMLNDHP